MKSFSVQQFFKNAAEVWASSPHLRSKSKLHHEIKQTSKKQSEESQLLLKSKGCNEIQGFRGNCDSQASWGCAPALPNRIGVVFLEELLLEKTVFSIRQKGVPPLLLPASVLQLPRCLTRTYNLDFHDLTLFELGSFKKCNCSRKNLLQIQFAPQMWAARPHLGSIFEKLLHRKTFQLPAARISAAISKNLTVLVFFHKNFPIT